MDIYIAQFMEWLSQYKDAFSSLEVIAGIVVSIIGGIWAWKKSRKSDSNPTAANTTNYSAQDNQIVVPINATNGATVKDLHIGDIHNHQGLDIEDALKMAEKLAAKKGEKDAQIIKSLQETIKALTEQPSVQEALDMLSQGKTELAENIFERIALEAKQKGKEAQLEEAAALRHIGSLAYLHDTQKALNSYQRSTELDPDNMDGWNQLGHLYRRIGGLEQSENAYRTILKLVGTDQVNQAVAYGNLGLVYQIRGKLDRAIEYHKKSLTIVIELGHKEGMASNYGNLGTVYLMHGESDLAFEYYQKALALNEVGYNKQGMASNYSGLGLVCQTCGELDQAVEYHQKALALNEELGQKEGMANDCGNLGIVYQSCGELDRAFEYYQKSLALNEALGRKEGMAIQYANLGNVYETRGELDQALAYYQKSLALNEVLGSKQGMAGDYGNLGMVYKIRGELDKAVEYWKKSLTLYTEVGMKPKMVLVQSWLDEANPKKAE